MAAGSLPAAIAVPGHHTIGQVQAAEFTVRAAALHRRFGFVEAGRLRGVGRKQGRWIDTVLMQRELGPGSR